MGFVRKMRGKWQCRARHEQEHGLSVKMRSSALFLEKIERQLQNSLQHILDRLVCGPCSLKKTHFLKISSKDSHEHGQGNRAQGRVSRTDRGLSRTDRGLGLNTGCNPVWADCDSLCCVIWSGTRHGLKHGLGRPCSRLCCCYLGVEQNTTSARIIIITSNNENWFNIYLIKSECLFFFLD